MCVKVKQFLLFVSAFVMISGGLSITTTKEEKSLSVNINLNDPDKATDAAAEIISAVGKGFQELQTEPKSYYDDEIKSTHTIYRIRNASCDPASQVGAYYDFDIAREQCSQGYCVFDQYGTLIYSEGVS